MLRVRGATWLRRVLPTVLVQRPASRANIIVTLRAGPTDDVLSRGPSFVARSARFREFRSVLDGCLSCDLRWLAPVRH